MNCLLCVTSFSMKNFWEHHGTVAYRPWCFIIPIAYGFHSEAYKAASGEWVRSIGMFMTPYPDLLRSVRILCSRAKSPMKNCNRRVNYCRMLTQNLNFMNTHGKKICIYVNSVALLYGLSIHKYFIWSFLNHKATI